MLRGRNITTCGFLLFCMQEEHCCFHKEAKRLESESLWIVRAACMGFLFSVNQGKYLIDLAIDVFLIVAQNCIKTTNTTQELSFVSNFNFRHKQFDYKLSEN